MEIRVNKKGSKKLKALNLKYKREIQITVDESVDVPIIMVHSPQDKLQEWIKGTKEVESFLKYGYMRVLKSCPHRLGKCKGLKCQLYHIRNGVGDCAHIWSLMK